MLTVTVYKAPHPPFVLRGDQALSYGALHSGDRVGSGDLAVNNGSKFHLEVFRELDGTLIIYWFPPEVSDEFAIASAYNVADGLRRHAAPAIDA